MRERDVVTGAFSYTGRAIAERLLAEGRRVRTLTRRDQPSHPLAGRVETAPLCFDERLVACLRGADTLYNTYWIRFERGASTFTRAVENSRRLFAAARDAGVRRVVHLSVSNAAEVSPLAYFRGKAEVERALAASGVSHAVVRPTLIFGPEDILVNNIAWLLRRFPFFVVPGRGDYRVQPVSVADVAQIAVTAGRDDDNLVVDAAGPERYTFEQLVRTVAQAIGRTRPILHAPPSIALALARVVGALRRDVVLTDEEIGGLMAELLVSDQPARGTASFREWVAAQAPSLGRAYVSELDRNFRRYAPL